MHKYIMFSLLTLATILLAGCPTEVKVDTQDNDPPRASLMGASQYSPAAVVTDDGQPVTIKCGIGEDVPLIASGFDPKGVRSVELSVVSGGILLDQQGARKPVIKVEKDTLPGGKGVDRILFPAKVEFDSPQQPLVLRVSSLDWAGNTAVTPVMRLEQYAMPVARISASSNQIDYGQTVIITYETENATSVFLNAQQIGTLNGSKTFSNLTQDMVFTLRAEGVAGRDIVSTTVFVRPQVNAPAITQFSADKYTLHLGEMTTLRWKCTNTQNVKVDPSVYQGGTTDGSAHVTSNSLGLHTYTITATGPGGQVTKTLSINVIPPQSTEECFRTNNTSGFFSFSKTQTINNGVTISTDWKMDLSLFTASGNITTIRNRSGLSYVLLINNSYMTLGAGQTTDLFEGFPVNSVYQVGVVVLANTSPPIVIDLDICYEPD